MESFKKISVILGPSIIMTLISLICFSEVQFLSEMDRKGLFIISLIIVFPIICFIQGVFTAANNYRILKALGTTIIMFLILLFIYLNSSALIYSLVYIMFGINGYATYNIIKKIKNKRKNSRIS